MKTKYWIALIVSIVVLCSVLSLCFLWPREAAAAEVWSDGKLLYTLDLHTAQSITVETAKGTNTVTVENGHIGVTAADCPDKHCMNREMCSGGAQIVCLPNRLVIRFVQSQSVDGVAG